MWWLFYRIWERYLRLELPMSPRSMLVRLLMLIS